LKKLLRYVSKNYPKIIKSKNKPNGEKHLNAFFDSDFIHPEGSPHLKGYKISSDKSCNVEPVLRKTANDLAESQSKIQDLNSQLKLSEIKLQISEEQLRKSKLNLKRTNLVKCTLEKKLQN
jgi:hypothetical protein